MVQTHSKPRTSPCKCASVAYTQYSVITGISMLDKSEAIIVNTFVVVMLLALMYYAAVFSPHFVRGIVNSAQA
ncbi:hypothetical protein FNF27_04563 [Cafeteria roenbergensis]|uniref:Uncharacterized protein n=1 Tax=Cafeteria roenbergensis TaxID=33653 RepID=A0A5A8C891_CAFRO|nr:hypothetical protein FNF29_06163 [Cafeteria roenbergensis]KAA0149283.1 hypothetical protein FNF31_07243 [Cafeteria roenbergensis]KAA0163060.1 hypothetical protein FNF28_04450 [Cafeteria roenbergensis]KAA0174002.1 hypothetical protein FNF27_04563 [Cafeteria roenbergensis]|eukprot:KAA0149075.1 hypothetical protein FNF29_06163 [Cafeteria roenbergensis]